MRGLRCCAVEWLPGGTRLQKQRPPSQRAVWGPCPGSAASAILPLAPQGWQVTWGQRKGLRLDVGGPWPQPRRTPSCLKKLETSPPASSLLACGLHGRRCLLHRAAGRKGSRAGRDRALRGAWDGVVCELPAPPGTQGLLGAAAAASLPRTDPPHRLPPRPHPASQASAGWSDDNTILTKAQPALQGGRAAGVPEPLAHVRAPR